MTAQLETGITVVVFGDRRLPRPLAALPVARIDEPVGIDAALDGVRRLVVAGSDADLAAVLSVLMRKELLDIEVAHVPGRLGARRALSGTARRIPLIRDDTGTALVGAALWLPPAGAATIRGETVVDDAVLFDGEVAGVRIEPTPQMPGLRATVLGGRRNRWVTGRAAQLGTTGTRVVRDGVAGPREVKRSTFYRHTTGWLRVG
ncbi:MAG: peptidase M50 [Mycobacteriaceae bacterium]